MTKVVGTAEQECAFALCCERLRASAAIRGPKVIGPDGNNDRVDVHVQILEDVNDALVPWEGGWAVDARTTLNGFRLSFRGGTEASLMLVALRDALNKLDLQPNYPNKDAK